LSVNPLNPATSILNDAEKVGSYLAEAVFEELVATLTLLPVNDEGPDMDGAPRKGTFNGTPM